MKIKNNFKQVKPFPYTFGTNKMSNKISSKKLLIDSHKRRIRKLRVSLLDACNFRCFYCLPKNVKFMNSSKYISPLEIEKICSTLCDYGLEQVRITGGEPTLRKEFREIVLRLSNLKVKKLGLTTNGSKLMGELNFLKDSRCKHINISLESLSKDNFKKITRKDSFNEVYSSIKEAKKLGFIVKVNVVLMKGINDHEIFDFIKFSSENDIEVRFLEVMQIGAAYQFQNDLFISADTAISKIKEQEHLEKEIIEHDSTSFNFRTQSGAKIGFIAPESKPFCGSCSRWRLSADGFLRACLMSNKGVKISNTDPSQYDNLLKLMLDMKPINKIQHVAEYMNQIGG